MIREKIVIKAGEHHIENPDREFAAVYLRGIRGDFVATTMFSECSVTVPYCGGGPMVKSKLAEPLDNSGCVIDWVYPKYAVLHY